jgi:DNA-binding HxlR family transcriptional regulator
MSAIETGPRRSACPINIYLELLGDSWSLLILRDMILRGKRNFQDFSASPEGIATNILSQRLGKLEAHGIVTKARDSADARRTVYGLTQKGFDLAPVLLEIMQWAGTYENTAMPPAMLDRLRNDRAGMLEELRARWLAAD